jgi:hypothetical protein
MGIRSRHQGEGRRRAGEIVIRGWAVGQRLLSAAATESDPEDLAELRSHSEARLPVLVFRAMGPRGSAGPHLYCRSLAEAVGRLAKGLQVLRELAGLEQQPEDP